MRRSHAEVRTNLGESLLWRPALFVAAGVALAVVSLRVDAALGPDGLPTWARFTAGNARLLYATLAGALLTVAGITFWVRSASVSLAAGQYSASVVMGFLEDWFQQSIMSVMLGLFAYVVTVFRVLPEDTVTTAGVPHLSVLLGIALAASSVVLVMGAIRNAVRSMYAGSLGRRITDQTVERVRRTLPVVHREPREAEVEAPPTPPVRVRAVDSGWVQSINEDALLAALPPGAVVQLEVRVGLYVIEGRPLADVWVEGPLDERARTAVRQAVRIGRRSLSLDVEFGVQQLVDLAVGSLSVSAGDVASAYEVVQQLELVLWELGHRALPPRASGDERGRTLIRNRHITYNDYVRLAFDRLRRVAATYPTVSGAMIVSASELARELEHAGFRRRAAALQRQVRLILAAAEKADLLEDDLEDLRRLARRFEPVTHAGVA